VRYIDLDLLLGDPQTQPIIDAAEAASQAVLAEVDPAERAALIDANRARWVAFRPEFQRVFGNKCWYVECRNPGTDDDIDHFRPKGRIAEAPDHSGYWWQALNWRNFRLSCHRANRLRGNPETGETHGKGDHFPLLVEQDRCISPANDLALERPTLLDPTDPADPPLLTFDIDGRVAVSPTYEHDENSVKRVEDSRVYLHLDWPQFKEDRQALYRYVLTKVTDGDNAHSRFLNGEAGARESLKAVARDLLRLTRDNEPYSRAAQAYISRFRDRGWVKAFVLPHIAVLPHLPVGAVAHA
jgi:uncharacterized protein (TIGR02646 family)